MIQCSLGLDVDGQWHERQLLKELQEIIKKYRENFDGKPVPGTEEEEEEPEFESNTEEEFETKTEEEFETETEKEFKIEDKCNAYSLATNYCLFVRFLPPYIHLPNH